jgi:hypothetical protein
LEIWRLGILVIMKWMGQKAFAVSSANSKSKIEKGIVGMQVRDMVKRDYIQSPGCGNLTWVVQW